MMTLLPSIPHHQATAGEEVNLKKSTTAATVSSAALDKMKNHHGALSYASSYALPWRRGEKEEKDDTKMKERMKELKDVFFWLCLSLPAIHSLVASN